MDAAFHQMVDRYLSKTADGTAEFGPHIDRVCRIHYDTAVPRAHGAAF